MTRWIRQGFWVPVLPVLVASLVLSACGGGGGGGGDSAPPVVTPPSTIPPSSQFKGTLINSNGGASASDWAADTCTDARHRNWVRAYVNESYLFYREAPLLTIDLATYAGSPATLFEDYTIRGVPSKDRFSFVITQAQADATFSSGTATSVGFTLRRDSTNGNIIRIAYVDPAGPAFAAGFRRGMVLESVDGVITAQSLPTALSNKLFASDAGTLSQVGVRDTVGGPVRVIPVATARFGTTPLLVQRVMPGTSVGYLAYNSFSTPIGEVQLADAIRSFANAGVNELVLDLRYNGGGFLDIAGQLGYMLAGPGRTAGQPFERLVYNDKRSADNEVIPFHDRILGFPGNSARAGEALPVLNLNRVFVITSASTCSASESVINGLQGVNVPVVLIGGTTCGKPYGFSQDNNCTLSYFGIEFEGRNAKGAITPISGVTPTCAAVDELDRELGDPSERMLAAALNYQRTGSCPAASALAAKLAAPSAADAVRPDEFERPESQVKLRARDLR